MDTIFATLACYLLAISAALAQTPNETVTSTMTTSDLNLTNTTTMATPSNSTVHATAPSHLTGSMTTFTSLNEDRTTMTRTTAVKTESTSHLQTSQSTTIMAPSTKSPSAATQTPATHTPTLTTMTTARQTTGGYTSSSETTAITTANRTHTVSTTSNSLNSTTQAVRLNISEKNMTIVFSVLLGLFAMALVVFMFHKCKHKIQYLHQPLNNPNDTDAFVADDDTLVISGGLYDGHPIYDNVPTASTDQSQFRLEFLH